LHYYIKKNQYVSVSWDLLLKLKKIHVFVTKIEEKIGDREFVTKILFLVTNPSLKKRVPLKNNMRLCIGTKVGIITMKYSSSGSDISVTL
jgi:hypothetical protein